MLAKKQNDFKPFIKENAKKTPAKNFCPPLQTFLPNQSGRTWCRWIGNRWNVVSSIRVLSASSTSSRLKTASKLEIRDEYGGRPPETIFSGKTDPTTGFTTS